MFVGCGAPPAATSTSRGRHRGGQEHPHRHRLAVLRVVRPHRPSIGRRVIVLGGGNTAMDCCRSRAPRRRGRQGHRALRLRRDEGQPWEKEDAMHEASRSSTSSKPSFTHRERDHRHDLRKVRRSTTPEGRRRWCPPANRPAFECDDVLVAVGQETRSPGSSATSA